MASLILFYTKSLFIAVNLLSLIVRTIILSGIVYERKRGAFKRPLTALFALVIIDDLISLSIGLLYFAHDAIEVGLDIYSVLYIPFIYLAYKKYSEDNIVQASALLIAIGFYYLSAAYFLAYPLTLWSIILLFLSLINWRNRAKTVSIVAVVSVAVILLSGPALNQNIKVVSYPLQPSSWLGTQWEQTEKPSSPYCKKGNVFADTYDPARLRILNPCVTVEGKVTSYVSRAEDGDLCFDVKPDSQYSYMLTIGSWILRKGCIHVEIVPGNQNEVASPEKGDYIKFTGVWVVDTDHGSWSEIHPVWRIEKVTK